MRLYSPPVKKWPHSLFQFSELETWLAKQQAHKTEYSSPTRNQFLLLHLDTSLGNESRVLHFWAQVHQKGLKPSNCLEILLLLMVVEIVRGLVLQVGWGRRVLGSLFGYHNRSHDSLNWCKVEAAMADAESGEDDGEAWDWVWIVHHMNKLSKWKVIRKKIRGRIDEICERITTEECFAGKKIWEKAKKREDQKLWGVQWEVWSESLHGLFIYF